MDKLNRVDEIRRELWRNLDRTVTGVEIQRLQEEANSLVLELVGKSEDSLGLCEITREPLTWMNVAKDEVGILVAPNNKLWSTKAVRDHAEIDFDEIAERRLGQAEYTQGYVDLLAPELDTESGPTESQMGKTMNAENI